jgi:hypothetical protein
MACSIYATTYENTRQYSVGNAAMGVRGTIRRDIHAAVCPPERDSATPTQHATGYWLAGRLKARYSPE